MVILPEIVLALGALGMLVAPRLRSGRLLGLLTLLLLLAAFDLRIFQGPLLFASAQEHFHGMWVADRLTFFFQLAIFATMGLLTLAVMGYARPEVCQRREFYVLLLLTTVGLLLVVGAGHLALLYLGLELVSVLSYLLVGFPKQDGLAVEGALKYFLFGALSTGVMLYGLTLLYGLTGTLQLSEIQTAFPSAMQASPLLSLIALLLVVVGLGFKVALVPFHMWAPDAYEGAAAPVAAFLSLGPKLAGFAVLMRLLLMGVSPLIGLLPGLLWGLAAATMTLGNLAALRQTNLKRLLAYSSIAHAGFIVMGLAAASPLGLTALLYYLVAYVLMNAGAFAGIIAVGNATGPATQSAGRPATQPAGRREDIAAFSGLSRREPALAFMIAICFLSLAGVPPLAGFFGKLWIFAATLETGAVGLAVIAGVNSVVAFFYYMRVIQAMYFAPAPPAAARASARNPALLTALAISSIGLFIVGLWQGPWLAWAAGSLPF